MSTGSHFSRRELRNALEGWRSGTLDELTALRLKELLRHDLHACQEFVEYGDMLTFLATSIGDETSDTAADLVAETLRADREEVRWKQERWNRYGMSLLLASAACLLIGWVVGISVATIRQPQSVATISSIYFLDTPEQSRRPGTQGLKLPDAGKKLVEYESLVIDNDFSFMEVEFLSGARLTIQGPATLQMESANSAILQSGRVLGVVPPRATGFTLKTPSGIIRDLGTEFALSASADKTDLSVLAGLVDCELKTARNETVAVRVASGEHATMDSNQETINRVAASAPAVSRLLDFHAGITKIQGKIHFSSAVPPLPNSPESVVEDTVMAYLERSRAKIRWSASQHEIRPLAPATPGLAEEPVRLDHTHLPNESVSPGDEIIEVDSYLFRLKTKASTTEVDILGTVAFRQPIVGIITSSAGLNATDATFSRPEFAADWLEHPDRSRGTEDMKNMNAISPDGRTLNLRMATRSQATGPGDELRVLVRHAE